MKLKELTIKNFRGIKHLELNLSSSNGTPLDLAVLAGPNGCGKTSILEACAILLGRNDLLPERDERELHEVFEGAKGYELLGEFEHNGKVLNAIKTSANGETAAQHKAFAQRYSKVPVEYFPSWRAPKLVGSVSVSVSGASRNGDKRMENNLANLKQTLVNLTASQAFETSAAAPEVSEELRHLLEKLNAAWELFFPHTGERFQADSAPHALGRKYDLFLKGRGTALIPIDSLSSGEIEIVSLIGRIARKNVKDGIVLIDEPELHLHPAWHSVIIGAMRQVTKGSQLIVATQSPQVLGGINAESVQLLKKKNNEICAERPFSSYGLDANRVLEELMDAPERIPDIKKQIEQVFHLIGEGKLKESKVKVAELRRKMPEEPELTRAEAMISRKEILGK
jgi:predicted ATP-dependent endonuclease of OLD family